MTPERTAAYGRVMAALKDVGPTKLLPREQDTIRASADALLFADAGDDLAGAAVAIGSLAETLVSSGRWLEESVNRLTRDVIDCGPTPVTA
jgi:hypothetical protein